MAAYEFISATVTLVYETGVKPNGDAIFATQTYQNVSQNAPAEQLSAVCAGIASLSKHVLNDIVKTQKDTIEMN